jgi:hypothetical protein
MKHVLLLGAALTLFSGVALADPGPADKAPPGESAQQAPKSEGPMAGCRFDGNGDDWGRDGWRHGPGDGPRGWRGGPGGDCGPGRHGWGPGEDFDGPHPWHHHGFGKGGPGFGPFSRGPDILLERGPNRIHVKCAEDESTQQCVDAAKDLLGAVAKSFEHGPRDPRPEMPPTPGDEGGPAPEAAPEGAAPATP